MCRRLLVPLALAVAALPAAATPVPPLPLYGHESAATSDDAGAAFVNPAGVGVRYPAELLGSWTSVENGADLGRWALALGGFGLGFERVGDVSHRIGLSQAAGGEPLRLGLGAGWHVDAHTHRATADQRLGLLSRPAPWLALGAVADHLFEPVVAGVRQDRAWTLAAGLRPLALDPSRAHGWGTRLTLSADVVLAEGAARGEARVRVGGELEALPGVLLRGALEDHGGAFLGVTLRSVNGTLAAQRGSGGGRHRSESGTLSLHAGEERTVLAGRAQERVALVRAEGDLGDDALSGFSLTGGTDVTPAKPLHEQLERALEDPLTRGVFLDLRGVSNMAQIEELRPRLARLRRAGKPVVAYLEYAAGRPDLYLASACDRVVMAPEAEPRGLGLRAERRYYRGLLASLGIRVERTSYGRYKSAYRNLSVDSTTAADREAIERNLDVNQELFVRALCADRGLDRERVLTVLDGRPWRAADLAAAGLVDSAGYGEDALALLGRMCGLGEKPRAATLSGRPPARREWTVPAPVAVVYAAGGIETGRSGGDLLLGPTLGSTTLIEQLERAFRRRTVKAVVLRIESPGGSALASDLIHHATLRLKRETRKPLIVSMGSMAGSGGYYIASGADRIYADRFTRTGSIGVLTIKPSLEQFYAKHGVRQDDFGRGDWMRAWSMNRDWTPAEQAAADSATLRFYHRFVELVAADRKLSWDAVDAVAQGRVWMGEDALERRLVDAIGGLEEALSEARRRAGVPVGERIRLLEYRRPRPGLLQRTLGGLVREAWDDATRRPEPGVPLYWMDADDVP
jgi:protease IV